MPYVPRCVVWNHRPALGTGTSPRLPHHEDLTSDNLWQQTMGLDSGGIKDGVVPGGKPGTKQTGLRHTFIDKNKMNLEDPLFGQREFTPRSIMLDYTQLWENHPKSDWLAGRQTILDKNNERVSEHGWNDAPFSLENEKKNALDYLILQRDALKKKYASVPEVVQPKIDKNTEEIAKLPDPPAAPPVTTPPTPPTEDPVNKITEDDRARWNQIIRDIHRLQKPGYEFLRTTPNAFDTGFEGIFWELGAANCTICYMTDPKKVILEQDRTILVRLVRLNAGAGQANQEMRVFFGNNSPKSKDNTLYALSFTAMEGLQFWHFRNNTEQGILNDLAERERLLNYGRITPREQMEIANKKATIATLVGKKDSYVAGREPKDNTPEIAVDVTQLDVEEIQRLIGNESQLNEKSKTEVTRIRDEIKAIKDGKAGGMPTEQKAALQKLEEEKLFLAKETVSISEDSQNFMERDVTFTITFHRKGHITINMGTNVNDTFTYKNKRIGNNDGTGTTWTYGTQFLEGSQVIVWSNGGQWGIALGTPLYEKEGKLWLQPFKYKYDVPSTVVFDLDGTGVPREIPEDFRDGWQCNIEAVGICSDPNNLIDSARPFNLLALPGCSIKVEIVQLVKPVLTGRITVPGEYQAQITFKSDGRYSPELFYFGVYILGGIPDKKQKVLWDSMGCLIPGTEIESSNVTVYDKTPLIFESKNGLARDGRTPSLALYPPGFLAPKNSNIVTKQNILDVSMQASSQNSAQHEVTVLSPSDNPAGLTLDLEGRMVDISLVDRDTGEQHYMSTRGIVHSPHFTERSSLETGPLHAHGRIDSEIEFMATTLEDVANRPSPATIPGNGRLVNEYIYDLLRNVGFYEDEFGFKTHGIIPELSNGLGTTMLSAHTLPPVSAGSIPDIKPEFHQSALEFINKILTDHFTGWKLICRVMPGDTLMRAHLVRWRDIYENKALQYSSKNPSHTKLSIRRKMELYQDVSSYYTSYRVRGDIWKLTGKRFSDYQYIPQATDPRFRGKSLYFIGYDIPLSLEPNPSLKSQMACTRILREYKAEHGLPPYYLDIIVPLIPDVFPNMVIWVDGIRVKIMAVRYSSLKTPLGQLMTLTCRLMDDQPLKYLAG